TWLCAQASSKARVTPCRSWYWSARVSASSRVSATAVVKATVAEAPGRTRIRTRRLKIGPSTGPTGPDKVAPPSRATRSASRPPAAAEKPGPVALVLHCADGTSVHSQDVDGPDRFLLEGSRPAAAQKCAGAGQKFRLQKQLAESRVGQVGSMRAQDDFGIAG